MTTGGGVSRLGKAAVQYARQGWYVFPLTPRGKVPLTAHGFKNATCDVEAVREMWAKAPDANIGLVPGPSGFVVIDVDGPQGLASARAAGLLSEPTLCVATGRKDGGQHRYYKRPLAAVTAGNVGPGTTVRCDAGYVVLPPSVHPSGSRYAWDRNSAVVGELPPGAVALLCRKRGPRETPTPEGKPPDIIPEGERSDTLMSLAGSMRRRGMTEDAIRAALTEENRRRCVPPLDASEVESVAHSVARYEPDAPAVATLPPCEAARFFKEIRWRDDKALPEPEVFAQLERAANAFPNVRAYADREHVRHLLQKSLAAHGIDPAWRIVERAIEHAGSYTPVPPFTRYDVETLGQSADAPDLIEGVLPAQALAVLFGPPGSGKSFLALDWALSVAMGHQWNGRAVTAGRVAYWFAEGSRARFNDRVQAWLASHGVRDYTPPIDFYCEPFALLDPAHVHGLIAALRDAATPPSLLVLDTLSRSLSGANENLPDTMGRAVAALDKLKAELGCTVLPLHHTPNANPERERGHSALRAAADVMWRLSEDKGGARVLQGSKARDGDLGPALTFELRPEGGSCVLAAADAAGSGLVSTGEREALRALVEATIPGEVLSMPAWEKASELSRATVYRHRKALERGGYVERKPKQGTVATPAGRTQIEGAR